MHEMQLIIRGPRGDGVAYRLSATGTTLGRSAECTLCLPDAALSRVHAEIGRDARGWWIEDCQSTNGTLLNGGLVRGRRLLRPGDLVQLGRTRIEIRKFDSSLPPTLTLAPQEHARQAAEDVLVGNSAPMQRVRDLVRRSAGSAATVLVTGESGTGKELVARLIHQQSERASEPFVILNCPAIPEGLIESELFGVERNVATGVEARPGIFEAARGGTVFLDEIGDMPLVAQARLLRVLQERTVQRVGGRSPLQVGARCVAATHHELHEDVQRGTFRLDLYHRLRVLEIRLPPLRERIEDIPALAAFFLSAPGARAARMSEAALRLLESHDFPGNVRELEHVLERAQVLGDGPCIEEGEIDLGPGRNTASDPLAKDGAAPPSGNDVYSSVVAGDVSFWDAVAAPYRRREMSREEVMGLVARAHAQAGRSYRRMARLLHVEADYRKLLNFLYYHRLAPDR